jgi:hypothetical protein
MTSTSVPSHAYHDDVIAFSVVDVAKVQVRRTSRLQHNHHDDATVYQISIRAKPNEVREASLQKSPRVRGASS